MKYIVIWVILEVTAVHANIIHTSYAVHHPPRTSGYAIVDTLDQVKDIIKEHLGCQISVFQAESLKEIKYSYSYKMETQEVMTQVPVVEIGESK